MESIDPVRAGISFEVTVDKGGGTSGLPNQWSHLKALLQVEAEKRTGIRCVTPLQERENQQDNSYWTDVNLNVSDLLLSASDHESALAEAIEQAHSHLLIVSAHVREEILNKLKDPIKAAIEREVRVDVLFGLPSLDEGGRFHADTTKDWLKEVRKSLPDSIGKRLTVNEKALDSDAKVLIWDTSDGSYHAILGSYNWLHGLDGPSVERIGSDIGIRLSDPRVSRQHLHDPVRVAG